MVRLVCLLVRKPGTTHEEFLAHWRQVHGPLVRGTKSEQHALRYEQHPRSAGSDSAYDGVTIQEFASLESFYASLQEPDYADIAADIETFLDSSKLAWLMTDEPTLVIPAGGQEAGI